MAAITPQAIIAQRYTINPSVIPFAKPKMHATKYNCTVEISSSSFKQILDIASKYCITPSEKLTSLHYIEGKNKHRQFFAQLVDKQDICNKKGEEKGLRLRIYLPTKERLGKGGFGEVHTCIKLHTGRLYDLAAKTPRFIKPDPNKTDEENKRTVGYTITGPALLREYQNVLTIHDAIEKNDKAKSRMHDSHLPIIKVLKQYCEGNIQNPTVLFEKGDVTIENLAIRCLLGLTDENMFAIARDVFNALLIMEDIGYINGDIKKENVLLKNTSTEYRKYTFRAKLIDFSSIIRLPPADQNPYKGSESRKFCEYTDKYLPTIIKNKLKAATTNQEVRDILIMRQRAAIGFVIYNTLTIENASLVQCNENKDESGKETEYVYSFRLKSLGTLPDQIQKLILALFSQEAVNTEPFTQLADLEQFTGVFQGTAVFNAYVHTFDKAYYTQVGDAFSGTQHRI